MKSVWPVALAVLVFVLYLLGINVLLLLLGGGLLFGVVRWLQSRQKGAVLSIGLPFSLIGVAETARMFTATDPLISITLAAIPIGLPILFLTFLKIGAVLYGSGYVLLAFLHTDFVSGLGWLTDRQLLDAISVGQFTPGPVFTTATFIGYLVAGLPGALLATLAIFLPSFAFIPLIHPLATRLRRSPWTSALLDGVNIAALALMAGVLFQLGQSALIDVLTWAIALISLGVLLRFKINSAWLIAAGAVVGFLRFWL
jgi:chromate transporter